MGVPVSQWGMEYRFADCVLDAARRRLVRAGAEVAVEPQVFDLLTLLAQAPDRVVSKDEIVEAVWGGRIVSESAISARIAAARKAVGDDGARQAVIRTVARRGLQMVAAVSVSQRDPAPELTHETVQRIRYVQLPSGVSMAYAIIGKGPPVILVQHGRSDLEAEWQLASERQRFLRMAERNTLVRFDAIGSGQSDRNPGRADIALQAEDIGHLVDHLGLDRFAMVSHSGGCNQLIHYAAHHPDRVSRIAMTGAYAEGRLIRAGQSASGIDPLREMLAQGKAPQGEAFFAAAMMAYQPEGPLDAVMAFARMVKDAASEDFELRVRDVINTHSNMPLLGRIACPTLILHSRGDAVHPLSEAQKLAAHIPVAELVALPCRNHIPMPGNAAYDAYMATLTDFLAEDPS